MQELFHRIWSNLLERTEGPMHFRFIMQPLMSVIFAVLAAIRDAKSGTAPFIARLIHPEHPKATTLKELWKDVGKIFIIGAILDIIYQLIVIYGKKTEARFYPLESIIVAFGLAILPYLLLRGPLNRLFSLFISKKKD